MVTDNFSHQAPPKEVHYLEDLYQEESYQEPKLSLLMSVQFQHI